jgi:type IV pilus assembly protein PilY1
MVSTYAIPSDVTAINTDFDAQGYIDRVLVGDMGGNVWRFDVDDGVAGNWKGELLASLSNGAGEKRKFFFPPAVAPQAVPFRFDAVYIGSGDKEHPLLTQSTTPATTDDRMFMLMDDPSLNSGGGTPDSGGNSVHATPITLGTLFDIADVATTGVPTASLPGLQGWSSCRRR